MVNRKKQNEVLEVGINNLAQEERQQWNSKPHKQFSASWLHGATYES
jgi:hypothetical protein